MQSLDQVLRADAVCYSIFKAEYYAQLKNVIIVCRNEMVRQCCEYVPQLNEVVVKFYFETSDKHPHTSLFERCVDYVMQNLGKEPLFLYALFIRHNAILQQVQLKVGRMTDDAIKLEVEYFIEQTFKSLEAALSEPNAFTMNTGRKCNSQGVSDVERLNNPTLPLQCDLLIPFYSGDVNRTERLKELIEYSKGQLRGMLYSSINGIRGFTNHYSEAEIVGASGLFPCKFLNFAPLRELYLYPRNVVLPAVSMSTKRVGDAYIKVKDRGEGFLAHEIDFAWTVGENGERIDLQNDYRYQFRKTRFDRPTELAVFHATYILFNDLLKQGIILPHLSLQDGAVSSTIRQMEYAQMQQKYNQEQHQEQLDQQHQPQEMQKQQEMQQQLQHQQQQQQQQQQEQQEQQPQLQLQQQEQEQKNPYSYNPGSLLQGAFAKLWPGKRSGGRSNKKGKKGTRRPNKKGTRRHSKKKSTRRH